MDLINMPPAWEINHAAGTGVTVAILDSGFTTIQGNFLFRIWNGTAFATFAVPFARDFFLLTTVSPLEVGAVLGLCTASAAAIGALTARVRAATRDVR